MKLLIVHILLFSLLFSTVGFSMEVHQCVVERVYSIYDTPYENYSDFDYNQPEYTNDCGRDKKTNVHVKRCECVNGKISSKNKMCSAEESEEFTYIPYSTSKFNHNLNHPPDHSPPLYILYGV